MFVLKQFLKRLILPPTPWIVLLLIVLVFWHRSWARKLLFVTVCLILLLHSGPVSYVLRYSLESQYAPLLDPRAAEPYDAIVVLTGGITPATGLIPFPSISESMFRRLDEALRLYRIRPKPIVVSGDHVDPFTPPMDENRIPRDFLMRWGVPKTDVIAEPNSRDTFESAVEVDKLLKRRGWKRYLLVTSATHMPRSMLAFKSRAPEPIPAPADFSAGAYELTPLEWFPSHEAARGTLKALHEYVGLANYYWRNLWAAYFASARGRVSGASSAVANPAQRDRESADLVVTAGKP
ncbi:MAG TPA: YdcF family protein [Candidatus Eisenbacteria bacterium]|nr:YdcF family protein [Candidatus Eisenbacteria bacterium]